MQCGDLNNMMKLRIADTAWSSEMQSYWRTPPAIMILFRFYLRLFAKIKDPTRILLIFVVFGVVLFGSCSSCWSENEFKDTKPWEGQPWETPYGECISMPIMKRQVSASDESRMEANRCLEKNELAKAKQPYTTLIESKMASLSDQLAGWDGLSAVYYKQGKLEMGDACQAHAITLCKKENIPAKELMRRLRHYAMSRAVHGQREQALETMFEYNALLEAPQNKNLANTHHKLSLKEVDSWAPLRAKSNEIQLEVLEGSVKVNNKQVERVPRK